MAIENTSYDLIIVGGGPAGSASAIYAARHGLKTLLLEKYIFPRDKICGDAVSGKSMNILKELNLLDKAKQLPCAIVDSVTFGSPDHTEVSIDFLSDKKNEIPSGLVIRRKIFDQFLFEEARKAAHKTIEGFKVNDLIVENGYVKGVRGKESDSGMEKEFYASIVLGADGCNSVVAHKAGLFKFDPQHWVVALRQYYKNVKGLNKQIELHYTKEVQPGYLWIFPLDDGKANVGIGMLHKTLKDNKINLKEVFKKAVESPAFKERFSEAEPLEEPRGWNLPVGSKHRKNYGNGFMLLGDAAGLVDPFTGEGIGNALYSARQAVKAAKEAIDANDVGEKFLSRYDKRLWDELGNELQISAKLQKIGRIRFLLNFVINKAARNDEVREIISGMMANKIPRKRLANPLFYLRLIFS
jgi:geranylgeranyl reductase family protein